jgi:hypothetical protein
MQRSGEETSMVRLAFMAVYTSLVVAIESAGAQGLTPNCTLPFQSISKHHPIDDNCAARGEVPDPPVAANDPAHALQNQAKNNFCATGTPALVTFTSFKKLQQKLDMKVPEAKHWTRDKLPADRSVFLGVYTTSEGATIGEGTVVTFAGWLMKLRPGSKESCNCGTTNGEGKEVTDMHLVVISSSDRENTPECNSVTVEISPHFRPERWDGHTLLSANDHPLRFTGQLMYDAAHRPCSGSPPTRGYQSPSRVSNWEVHPVYAIDVCKNKSLSGCKANNASVWKPLDQWEGD